MVPHRSDARRSGQAGPVSTSTVNSIPRPASPVRSSRTAGPLTFVWSPIHTSFPGLTRRDRAYRSRSRRDRKSQRLYQSGIASQQLVKSGAGTLTLLGDNLYGGGTTVDRRHVAGQQHAPVPAPAAARWPSTTATLGGDGSLGGAVTVNSRRHGHRRNLGYRGYADCRQRPVVPRRHVRGGLDGNTAIRFPSAARLTWPTRRRRSRSIPSPARRTTAIPSR